MKVSNRTNAVLAGAFVASAVSFVGTAFMMLFRPNQVAGKGSEEILLSACFLIITLTLAGYTAARVAQANEVRAGICLAFVLLIIFFFPTVDYFSAWLNYWSGLETFLVLVFIPLTTITGSLLGRAEKKRTNNENVG